MKIQKKLAAEILSEKDPAAAWTDWVMNENRPKVKVTEEAKNTVEDNMELLEKLGIETVPAIYLADGEGPYGVYGLPWSSSPRLSRKAERKTKVRSLKSFK